MAIKETRFWDSIEWAYHLFFATFPFIIYSGFLYNASSTRSLNLVIFAALLALAVAAWIVGQKGKGLLLPRSPLFLALLLYFGALIVSGIQGANWSITFWSVATRTTGVWYFFSLGLVMFMLAPLFDDAERRLRLIRTVVVSSALYSFCYLLSARGIGVLFPSFTLDGFTFGNSTFAGMYLFGAFLLSVYYVYQAKSPRWWMYVLPFVLVLNPAFIEPSVFRGDFSRGFVGEARSSTAALVLSVVAISGIWLIARYVHGKAREIVSWSLFGVGVVTVVVVSWSLLTPDGYVRELYLSQGSAARPLVWGVSETAIRERPFLGWGADNFERVFETHFDNRLLEKRYGNEAWFDRAHNVYVDQLLDNGIVGLILYALVYLVTTAGLLYAMLRLPEMRERALAAFLVVYFPLHLVELQTAFDTSISYPLLGFLFMLAVMVVGRAWRTTHPGFKVYREFPAWTGYVCAGLLIFASLWSLFVGVIPFTRAQIANGTIRTIGSVEKRLPMYPALFGSPLDEQAFLWRIETDFQRGIAEDPSVLENPKKASGLLEEAKIYEQEYRDYLSRYPTNFRAHLSLADILIYQVIFGERKLDEARDLLDEAVRLVPQSPLPYWMKAVSYVYEGKFAEAQTTAKAGIALNPGIETSQLVLKYVEQSQKDFPEISMYFFRQI